MSTSTFENADGSFFDEASGVPVTITAPTTGSTVTMKATERAYYANHGSTIAALTVKLPRGVQHGEMVWLGFKSAVTTLTIQDGFGVTIGAAPTSTAAAGVIVLRYLKTLAANVGWVVVTTINSGPDNFTNVTVSGYFFESAANAVTAAGTSQATATPLTAMVNNVTIVAAGTGVNLPPNVSGLEIMVGNFGLNPLTVYPAQGATDTINGQAATVGVVLMPGAQGFFVSGGAGVWTMNPSTTTTDVYNTNAATAGTTLTAANITGGSAGVVLNMTGALAGAANAQLPTVAAMLAAMHGPAVGSSFRLRIINSSSGAFAWTVTTNTGWTLNGTMSINQNTWREFDVKITAVGGTPTATLQNVGTGSWS